MRPAAPFQGRKVSSSKPGMATFKEPEGEGRPAAVEAVGLGAAELGAADDCGAFEAGAAEVGAGADVVAAGLAEVGAGEARVELPDEHELAKRVTNRTIDRKRKPRVDFFKSGNLCQVYI